MYIYNNIGRNEFFMKKYVILGIIAIFVIIGIFFFFSNPFSDKNNSTNNNFNSYNSEQISFDQNLEESKNRVSNIIENSNEIMQNVTSENEISSYSTVIKDKEPGRLTNISITCSILNNTIIRKRTDIFF